jgi:hypothetical protein
MEAQIDAFWEAAANGSRFRGFYALSFHGLGSVVPSTTGYDETKPRKRG